MTKVRVCVGLSKKGNYYAFGDNDMSDKELEDRVRSLHWKPTAEVVVSFHDLEVESPQAPVEFEFGDLVRMSGSAELWAVSQAEQGDMSPQHLVVVLASCFPKLNGKSLSFSELESLFNKDYTSYEGWGSDNFTLLAKAGNWHIANGKVVLYPPPQPEPEVKTKFQFGDLVKWVYAGTQYVVTHTTLQNVDEPGVTVVQPQYFYKVEKPVHYNQLNYLLGFGGESTGRVCDGHDEKYFTLIAPAGQWHINSSGEVVLKPKPEVSKPKFKRGDRVTRMQLGKLETWRVVDPVPNEDELIVLLGSTQPLYPDDTWSGLVEAYGERACGYLYRMSYEDDCTLVPEVTAPQESNTVHLDTALHYVDIDNVVWQRGEPLKPGDMVVDQGNELWDVDELSGLDTWVTSKNLVGRKKVPTSTLKKVVFGTL